MIGSWFPLPSCSNIRENTIASMKDAIAHGADLVEFDVQISKDLVPVIYHDYELVTSIVKKKGDQKMWVQMPLKNLTLEQLHSLKVKAVSLNLAQVGTCGPSFHDDQHIFSYR